MVLGPLSLILCEEEDHDHKMTQGFKVEARVWKSLDDKWLFIKYQLEPLDID